MFRYFPYFCSERAADPFYSSDSCKHLKLDVTTAAKDFIIDSSYDSVYGARPIKRFIQSRVETLIAKAIIQGSYTEGATLTVDYDGTGLVLR